MDLNSLGQFLSLLGVLIGVVAILGLSPGPGQPESLITMIKHPIRYRIRPRSVEKGIHISELALMAPYLYLTAFGLLATGLLLILVAD